MNEQQRRLCCIFFILCNTNSFVCHRCNTKSSAENPPTKSLYKVFGDHWRSSVPLPETGSGRIPWQQSPGHQTGRTPQLPDVFQLVEKIWDGLNPGKSLGRFPRFATTLNVGRALGLKLHAGEELLVSPSQPPEKENSKNGSKRTIGQIEISRFHQARRNRHHSFKQGSIDRRIPRLSLAFEDTKKPGYS